MYAKYSILKLSFLDAFKFDKSNKRSSLKNLAFNPNCAPTTINLQLGELFQDFQPEFQIFVEWKS